MEFDDTFKRLLAERQAEVLRRSYESLVRKAQQGLDAFLTNPYVTEGVKKGRENGDFGYTQYIKDGKNAPARYIAIHDSAVETPIHELTHASSPQPQLRYITKKGVKLLNENERDDYLDKPSEIYSRLMEFRKAEGIDPHKRFTKEDIDNYRKAAGNGDPLKLFDRYDDDTLLMLFNETASSNDGKKFANYAKYGNTLTYNLTYDKLLKSIEFAKEFKYIYEKKI